MAALPKKPEPLDLSALLAKLQPPSADAKDFPEVNGTLNPIDYPTLSTSPWPEVYKILTTDKRIIEIIGELVGDLFQSARQKDIKNNEWDKNWRFSREDLDKVLSLKEPWKLYPCAAFVPLEQPNPNAPDYEDSQRDLEEIVKLIDETMVDSKVGDQNPKWWAFPHFCETNSVLLFQALQKAFPNKKFRSVSSPVHTWIQDNEGRNYDFYWPAIGLDSLMPALYDKNGKKYDLKYRYQPMGTLSCMYNYEMLKASK